MQSEANPNSNQSKFKLKLAGVTCALLFGTSSAFAVPAVQGAGCGLTTLDTTNASFLLPDTILGVTNVSPVLSNNGGLISGAIFPAINPGEDLRVCVFTSLPSLTDMNTTCDIVPAETNLQTNYVAFLHTNALPSPTFCLYKYDIDLAAVDVRTNGALVTTFASPAAVPIFTPLGLLAMMSGLLWFGKRRRKFK